MRLTRSRTTASIIAMFRKPPSSDKDKLNKRIRAISASTTSSPAPANAAPTRAARKSVFRDAVLTLPDGKRLKVALRDLSDNGARVEFFEQHSLPPFVMLSEPTLKLKRRARVAWQRQNIAGLVFEPD